MTDLSDLTPAQTKALETAEKLMRLAGKNPNKHEAEAASAKAMKILEDLNLDMSVIEQGGSGKAKRSNEKLNGGLYKWQRDLWAALAELHFCFYWNQYTYDPDKKNKYQSRIHGRKIMGGYKFEHRVVGRTINVVAVKNMAEYLEGTIERLTREHLHGDHTQFFTNYAASFRSGMAEEIVYKIYERRRHLLAEEKRKQKEAEDRAEQAAASGASTSRAITISSVVKQEEEANYDFLYGEGEWQKRKERMARIAQRQKEAEEEYARWAAANPEEAKKMEQERLKEARRRTSWNAGMGRERDNRDYSAYRAGRAAGSSVGLDPQTDRKETRQLG